MRLSADTDAAAQAHAIASPKLEGIPGTGYAIPKFEPIEVALLTDHLEFRNFLACPRISTVPVPDPHQLLHGGSFACIDAEKGSCLCPNFVGLSHYVDIDC